MTGSSKQKLQIPFIGEPLLSDNQEVRSKIRQNGVHTFVDKINWPAYPYQPLVQVWSGYSSNYLFLLFEVKGDFFRAKARIDQEAVWEDSCVEFFISTDTNLSKEYRLDEHSIYRNFEFNVLGVCLSAFGSKLQRESLPADEMKQILRFPVFKGSDLPEEGTEFNWELGVAVPLNILGLQPGCTFKANLYKCGDLSLRPHFLSWNSINSASPDFHLPQFFGDMELVS